MKKLMYEDFVSMVCAELRKRMPEEEIRTETVEKLQGQSYFGISVRKPGSNLGLTTNLMPMYERFTKGADLDELLDGLQSSLTERMDPCMNVPTPEELYDYSTMKDKLMIQVVSTERNSDMMKNIPHYDVCDMSIIYRVNLGDTKGGYASAVVTNELLNNFGVTAEQLHADALANAAEKFPASIRTMREVIAEMSGISEDEFPPDDTPMLMATCNGGIHGAACMFYDGFMEQASKRLGGDFFLLPSSVHEVIMVPDTGEENWLSLQEMVTSINADQVAEEDQLTNSVYHYDAKNHIFEKAESFFCGGRGRVTEKREWIAHRGLSILT